MGKKKPRRRVEPWSDVFCGYDIEAIRKYEELHGRELVIVAGALLQLSLS